MYKSHCSRISKDTQCLHGVGSIMISIDLIIGSNVLGCLHYFYHPKTAVEIGVVLSVRSVTCFLKIFRRDHGGAFGSTNLCGFRKRKGLCSDFFLFRVKARHHKSP